MQYTINELYDHLLEKVNNVYEVFKGFFGESYVDLQSLSPEVAIKHRIMHKMSVLGIDEVNLEKNDFDIPFEITDSILKEIESNLSDKRFLIYVWWPTVTVTNEYNKSIDIQDLYAKIEIGIDGKIPYEYHGFLLNRATYTPEQFISGYLHSHVNGIPKHDFARFMEPCLGRGPIRNTILTLKNDYDETEWMLFCQELSMYVTVESLSGIPYKKLEDVGINKKLSNYTNYDFYQTGKECFLLNFPGTELKKFIEYYLRNGHLSLVYKRGCFTYGMPYHEYIIDISNSFIDYYNKCLTSYGKGKIAECFRNKLLYSVRLIDGTFYKNINSNTNFELNSYIGIKILTFKNKIITLNIKKNSGDTEDPHVATVINPGLAMYILKNILRTINYRYRNEYYRTKREYFNSSTSEETTATTGKRAIYL